MDHAAHTPAPGVVKEGWEGLGNIDVNLVSVFHERTEVAFAEI